MLMYGNANNIQDDCIVYNFSGLIESIPNLNLMPPNKLGAIDEYSFDLAYFHWIFDNDIIFMRLMNIILPLYAGKNVYLVVSDEGFFNDWGITLRESLLKLIQQRYGINGVNINSFEDRIYATDDDFTDYGVINLDNDLDRYRYLYESNRINCGGQIINE